MRGIEALLEVLAGHGIDRIFGNPGTTELPLNQALAGSPGMQYILGLQEIPVMAMADGYAMARGDVAVVNVHAACGLGNSLGMLYNAWQEGSPLLVTAGQQDRRLRLGEPVLEADLVAVARPWTKWACEIQRADDIPQAVRRAIQTALAPPRGPVFLSLPVDLQQATLSDDVDLSPPSRVDYRGAAAPEAIRAAAAALAGAQSPRILAGSRVVEDGAIGELTRLAELLAAPVHAECTTSHGRLPIAGAHPLYRSALPLWSSDVRAALDGCDVFLSVGANVFRLYIHQPPDCPLPSGLQLIQADNRSWEIGKNYPVDIALCGHLQSTLESLNRAVAAELAQRGAADAERRAARGASFQAQREAERESLLASLSAQRAARPMTPQTLMHALAETLPRRAAVVEEAITTHHNLFERLGALGDPEALFAHRGWALGWGMGCALGVQLAWPGRPVLGLIGDGAALYGIQALWSAAHYQIPVTFVIANNRRYKILQVCGDMMSLPEVGSGASPGIQMAQPDVDFVMLSQSLGVAACRVETPEALRDAVSESWKRQRPMLIEALIGES